MPSQRFPNDCVDVNERLVVAVVRESVGTDSDCVQRRLCFRQHIRIERYRQEQALQCREYLQTSLFSRASELSASHIQYQMQLQHLPDQRQLTEKEADRKQITENRLIGTDYANRVAQVK